MSHLWDRRSRSHGFPRPESSFSFLVDSGVRIVEFGKTKPSYSGTDQPGGAGLGGDIASAQVRGQRASPKRQPPVSGPVVALRASKGVPDVQALQGSKRVLKYAANVRRAFLADRVWIKIEVDAGHVGRENLHRIAGSVDDAFYGVRRD